MQSGIYRITCRANMKSYIGSAIDFDRRWYQHKWALKSGRHYNLHLQNAWNKHGAEKFSFEKLIICSSENVIFYEQLCLDALNPEFNNALRAGNTLGTRHSQATRDKIRRKAIGRKCQQRSDLHKQKLSAAHKGKAKPQHVMDALQRGRANHIITDSQRAALSQAIKLGYENGTRSKAKTEQHKNKIGQYFARFTDDQIREIRSMSAGGISGKQLAKIFETPTSTISQIVNKKRYKWVA